MIGVVTTVFWIFLIIFSVSVMYSAKDIQFTFGDPQSTVTDEGKLQFCLPITINNRGQYGIGFFNVTTTISDNKTSEVAAGFTSIPIIPSGSKTIVSHNVIVDLHELFENHENYLLYDGDFSVNETIGLNVAEVVPVHASTTLWMPWGAPLYGFSMGAFGCEPSNSSHVLVRIPMSFENHALFELIGDAQLKIYDDAGALISEGRANLNVPPHSSYNGFIEAHMQAMELTPTGRFELILSTQFFEYGPVVTHYG